MQEEKLKPAFSRTLAQTRWGGCWDQSFVDIGRSRSDVRDRNYPEVKFSHLGFRLVRDQEETCKK